MEATSSSLRSRRALIAAGLGGLAATAAHAIGRPLPARAGHDGTNVFHLGESNTAPVNAATGVEADVDSHALTVRNVNTGPAAGVIRAIGSASSKPVILAECDNENTFAVLGVSSSPGFTDFGGGNGTGVQGQSGGGTGVEGVSASGPGISGHSASGAGVEGHSQTGLGGSFSTDGGDSAVGIGGNAVGFALGVDNSAVGENAGGLLAVSRGGKPAIEGDAFPNEHFGGIGVQGVSYSDIGDYGEGPGTGVEGISGDGVAVHGRSRRAAGVVGVAGEPELPPPFGEPGLSFVGVMGFAPLTDDPFGRGVVGVGQVGVLGVGGVFGVNGRATNAFAGNFVNDGTSDGAGVRAISPGDRPAVIAWSGIEAEGGLDGGLALEVLGKARFSTAGAGVVAQGSNSVSVANEAVTALSHITVTLVGNPGTRLLRWVERSPGVGFTVHFSGGPPGQRPQMPFTYLIVEPA